MSDGSAEAVRGIWGEERNGRDICPCPPVFRVGGKSLSPIFHWRPSLQPQETPAQERKLNRKGRLGLPSRPTDRGTTARTPPHHHSMGPTPLAGKSSSPAEASPSLRLPRSLFLSYSEVYSYSACPTTPNPSVTPSHPAKEVPATKFHWAPSSSLGIDIGLSC